MTYMEMDMLGYAKHAQEIENVINGICEGQTSFNVDDEFTDSEIEYIQHEVQKRYNRRF